jgi:hypothetical protein
MLSACGSIPVCWLAFENGCTRGGGVWVSARGRGWATVETESLHLGAKNWPPPCAPVLAIPDVGEMGPEAHELGDPSLVVARRSLAPRGAGERAPQAGSLGAHLSARRRLLLHREAGMAALGRLAEEARRKRREAAAAAAAVGEASRTHERRAPLPGAGARSFSASLAGLAGWLPPSLPPPSSWPCLLPGSRAGRLRHFRRGLS